MPRDREPGPELTTTPVGGSGRAKVIALAAVVVLAGAVYVGVSGRTDTPAPQSTFQGPAQIVPAPPNAAGPEMVRDALADPDSTGPYSYLGLGLWLAGQHSLAVLHELRPGYLYGSYWIPLPVAAHQGTLELVEVGSEYEGFGRFGRWVVPIDPLIIPGISDGVVLDEVIGPDATAMSAPGPNHIALDGFHVTARAERDAGSGLLAIEIHVGHDPLLPAESYSMTAVAGERHFPGVVDHAAPGLVTGHIVLPDRVRAPLITLALTAIPMADPLLGAVTVATWSITLPATLDLTIGKTALDVSAAPAPVGPGQPQILANGYSLSAVYGTVNGLRTIAFELAISPLFDTPQSLATR